MRITRTGPARIPRSFFEQPTLQTARGLLGARLIKRERGRMLSGIIIEAEAYVGTGDLGCHASRGGRTARNAVMFGPPGRAYVYFTYGMHWMLNVVTEREGFPAAVLLRAIVPSEGEPRMRRRRSGRPPSALTDGPAKLCQALGIDRRLNGHDLCAAGASLSIERGVPIARRFVTRGPRVGLNGVPEPWKSKPWRFRVSAAAFERMEEERDGTA